MQPTQRHYMVTPTMQRIFAWQAVGWPALYTKAKLSVLEELAYAREAAELMCYCAALVWGCNHHNALPADTTCQHTS